MVMSREQSAGRSLCIKTDNSSFEKVEKFKYLGTTLRYQNFIQEEIKTRRKSRTVCYRSVQNLFVFQFATKNTKILRYREL